MRTAPRHAAPEAIRRLVLASPLTLLLLGCLASSAPTKPAPTAGSAATLAAPATPTALRICGLAILKGPSTQPTGSVMVPSGDNTASLAASHVGQLPAGTTYWFATGVHTLGKVAGNYIEPGSGDTFIGAPGAILDGQSVVHQAFVDPGGVQITGVTISYLTVRNFNSPFQGSAVGDGAWSGWTMSYDTISKNYPGSGVNVTTNGTLDHDCLTHNGQYGFLSTASQNRDALTGGATDVTVTHDEIALNDICNLAQFASFPINPLPATCSFPAPTSGAAPGPGCGCDGAFKFWHSNGSLFEWNYSHDNYGTGAWWDTNNNDAVIKYNYVSKNWVGGVAYEISYNALIEDNSLVDNAWQPAALVANTGFPNGAIYISGSGGDARVPATDPTTSDPITTVTISGNRLIDNWSGVVLFQSADRFCNGGTCTLADPSVANSSTCNQANLTGTSAGSALFEDCQWKLQNVSVTGNSFSWHPADIPGCVNLATNMCGAQVLVYGPGKSPSWSPYLSTTLAAPILTGQNNIFDDNSYFGPWRFGFRSAGTNLAPAAWQTCPAALASPVAACQDLHSTFAS